MGDAFDDLVPHFRMSMERWPDARGLNTHYLAIRESHERHQFGLVASIRSFVESVCITILTDRGKAGPAGNATLTSYFVEAMKSLGLDRGNGSSNLGKVLSGYHKIADAISLARNSGDPVAHGKDGFADALGRLEQRSFLIAADALLGALLGAETGAEPDLAHTREPYERFSHTNQQIDRKLPVEIGMDDDNSTPMVVVRFRTPDTEEDIVVAAEPSRYLFEIDRSAYVEALRIARAAPAPPEEPVDPVPEADVIEVMIPTPPGRGPSLVPAYEGRFDELKSNLSAVLAANGIKPDAEDPDGNRLCDSILATATDLIGRDWAKRETLQAAFRVSVRRVLVHFEHDREKANGNSELILKWFLTYTSEPDEVAKK